MSDENHTEWGTGLAYWLYVMFTGQMCFVNEMNQNELYIAMIWTFCCLVEQWTRSILT